MTCRVEATVPILFEDGRVVVNVNGQDLDLMKLDTAQEMKTALWAIASDQMFRMASVQPEPPAKLDAVQMGTDLSGDYADQIRKSFQDQADQAQERLRKLTQQNESALKAPSIPGV